MLSRICFRLLPLLRTLLMPEVILQDLELLPEESELSLTRNTKSVANSIPGEVNADGSYVDAYGFKHYACGVKYQFSPNDRRLTAHGAYAGPHSDVRLSDTDGESGSSDIPPKYFHTALLYIKGMSRREIATTLGISEQTVTVRLKHASVKEFMAKQKEVWTEDLHALTESAVEVLRDAMDTNEDMKYRLAGADKVLKANDRLGSNKATAKEETATSQLQQLVTAIQGENVTVNIRS